jgi:hypothetical protein
VIHRSPLALVCLLGCLLPATLAAGADKKSPRRLPREATLAIRAAADAARKQDLVALRRLMIDEFTWSFGGDSSADQAIAAWKKDPGPLLEMDRVLRLACRTSDDDVDHIECPGKGNRSYRAAFIKTAGGWKMINFVAGD